MSETKTVHQCLFCSQTFDSAAEKDDHILEHFARETCMECNQNLIRIGGNLFTLHNSITCIRSGTKLEQQSLLTEEPDILGKDERKIENCNANDMIVATTLSNTDYDEQIIKVEPTIEYYEDRGSGVDLEGVQIKEECIYDADTEVHGTIFTEQLQVDSITCEPYLEPNDPMTPNIGHFMVDNFNEPNSSRMKKPQQSSHSKSKSKQKTAKNAVDKLKCDICDMTFSHVVNVRRHKIYFHSQPGTHLCRICTKIFANPEALAEHRIGCYEKKKIRLDNPKIHIGKSFECYVCRRVAPSRRKLYSHMRNMHVSKKAEDTHGVKNFVCTWCGKVFSREYLLKQHENSHTGLRPYVCRYGCGKSFAACSAQRAHMRYVHEGQKRYQCKIDGCDQAFGGSTGFKKHKRDVHGIPYVDKRYQTKLKPHEKEKTQYRCPYLECKKIFVHHSSRYKHVKEVHEGIKKYKCKIDGCLATFGGAVGLRNHKRDVHGVPIDWNVS
ncbi:zinc finger protein 135-like [Sitodiplosis mosellana]|uniref:zinc finger protein 135-like n=1 Tax=Sitodiplosis mosellana TaxID=263140 RepID=UPI002444967E|nr:zinc finger protein 135-like [Sitodiplosis mosellana]